jgi:hypothetical protein
MGWVSKLKGKSGGKKPSGASAKAAAKQKSASTRERAVQQTSSAEPAAPPPAEVQRQQVTTLAHVMFQVIALEQKAYANREELASGWRDSRAAYVRMARKIIRNMARRGIELSGSPSSK